MNIEVGCALTCCRLPRHWEPDYVEKELGPEWLPGTPKAGDQFEYLGLADREAGDSDSYDYVIGDGLFKRRIQAYKVKRVATGVVSYFWPEIFNQCFCLPGQEPVVDRSSEFVQKAPVYQGEREWIPAGEGSGRDDDLPPVDVYEQ